MVIDNSFFSMACAAVIALLFGLALCAGGYRFFLILLPIWGFFFGFTLGAQTIQLIFGEAFLASVTSWVVGFVVAVVFAVASYLIFLFAVALIAGSLGYTVAMAVMMAIGLEPGFIGWLIAIAAAVVLAVITLRFNLERWVIIIATAFLGSGVIVGVFLWLFGGLPQSELVQNPVRLVLNASPLWMITFIIVGVLGVTAQVISTRTYELEPWENPMLSGGSSEQD